MQIFYAPDIEPPLHALSEEESRHCTRVLRMGVGSRIHLIDGRGGLYTARIVEVTKRCLLEIESAEHQWGRRNYTLTMAVAPTKNIERFEWFLEKATEVGVDTFIPLLCDHSERRTLNHDRLKKIIIGAAKQSLKSYIPDLQPPTPFDALAEKAPQTTKLIAHCAPGNHKYITQTTPKNQNTLILIGPEGDFSPREISLAKKHNFTEITLGTNRLRTETAAIQSTIEIAIINR